MVPGDLIFYSATFYDKKKKRQKHDMVHVEIFLGGETGENSIGARLQRGTIKIFDSFKFVSKGYYDIVWHYRSLDTWLNGVCKSFCPVHDWDRGLKDDVDSNKFSIFKIEDVEDASGDEEEEFDDKTKYSGVYVGPGNNGQLIKDYCCKSGQEKLLFFNKKENYKTYLKWVQLVR